MKYIVYRKYFQAHRKSIFIGSVRPTRKRLILWVPLTSKGKAYFSLRRVTRQETSVYMLLVALLVYIFQ